MAKKWFTPYPDIYFMKTLKKGGRNEFLFAFLGIFILEKYFIRPAIDQQYQNKIETKFDFQPLKLNNSDLFIQKQ